MKPVRFAPGVRPLLLAVALLAFPGAAQNLSSVSLSPTSVTGGTASTGTVTLSANAPTGGKVVTLSSGNTGAATVPTSVTVASGSKTKTFTVSTTPQPNNASAVITAVLGTVSKTATLAVKAPVMSAASVSPASVTGGTAATLTVTLTGNAPTGGTVVTLTSGNTQAATLPASVTVLAGAKTATATVTSLPVGTNATVVLTATAGGVSKTASLLVKAPAMSAASVSPTSVTGGTGATLTVTLTGNAPTGGTVVTLTSGNTQAATLPASVTVLAGAKTVTAAVATLPVGTNATVVLTAIASGVSKTASLTVKAPAAASHTVSPGTVAGTLGATGTVTLNGPAPSAGALVTLSSNNTSAATVPSTVTVLAGATIATFPITTLVVTSRKTVTLSAVTGGATKNATLYVDPPSVGVVSVSFDPPVAVPGSPSTGTVTLTRAPSSDVTVALASSRPSDVVVPASFDVTSGQISGTFAVTTSASALPGPSTITATLNGAAAQGSLPLVAPVVPALGIDLVEGSLSAWQGFADVPYVASVASEVTRVKAGSSSLRFVTDTGFDCGVRYTVPAGAHWDLRGIRFLTFWSYGDGTEAYQGEQPVLILKGPRGSIRFQPPDVQTVNGAWRFHRVPLGDTSDWIVTTEGDPSLGDITSFEIHQDTWGMGLTVFFDGVAFSSDLPEDLAEGTAVLWGTFASDNEPASVVDDGTSVRSGASALRFDTASGFDTGLVFPKSGEPHWDLSDVRSVSFWILPTNTESFQGNQPVLVLRSPSGSIRYEPGDVLVNAVGWRFYEILVDGTSPWTRTQDGNPDITDVTAIEIHADTWGYGFRFQVDGVSVGRPLPLLTLPAPSAPAGSTVTASVFLSDAAPAGGRTVLLFSSAPAVASVPATVVVPEGARSASFALTAGSVTAGTPVTITVTDRGYSVRRSLRVDPVVDVTSLTVSRSTAFGGLPVTGTVTIANPAWAGGVSVTLTSSNPIVVGVPPAIVVPEGATTAAFEATPVEVLSSTTVTISANAGAATATASLTVVPTPPVELASISTATNFTPGGYSLPVTCTLTAPAPPGGRTIALTSSAPESLSVPATLFIGAGAMQGTVDASAPHSVGDATVTLTATDGAIQKSVVVTVIPRASLMGLSLSAPDVFPGETLTGTVEISDQAPTGGYLVTLTSSSADVLVPPTVTVPAGGTSATFTVSVSATAAGARPGITGSSHGLSNGASFYIVALQSFTASTSAAGPGVPVELTLRTSSQIPAGRTMTITITSSAPAVASVPATAVLAAGQFRVTVPVSRVDVATDTPVEFTATAYGTSRTVPFVVESLRVQTVVQANGRTTVSPCGSETLSIYLNGFAPTGGTPVDVTIVGGHTADGTVIAGSSPPARRFAVAAGSGGVTVNVVADWTAVPASLVLTARNGSSEASGSLALTPGTARLGASNPQRGATLGLYLDFLSPAGCPRVGPFDAEITSSNPSVLAIASPARFDVIQWEGFYAVGWRAVIPVPATASAGTTRITVTAQGATSWVDVTIPPSAITGLSVNPKAAPGGAVVTGTVTLDSLAPAGGPAVFLESSDSSRVVVPSSLAVPGGVSSVEFPVSVIGPVSDSVIVTATYLGASRSAAVKVLSSDAGRIVGRIVDDSRWDYVAGIKSAVIMDNLGATLATSGDDGAFSTWHEPGNASLTIETAGFVSRLAGPVTLPVRGSVDLGTIGADKVVIGACPVQGRVVDTSGQPVSGATLKLVGYDVTLTSVADGSFGFTGPRLARYRVRTEKAGFSPILFDMYGSMGVWGTCGASDPLVLGDLVLPPVPLPEIEAFWAFPPVLEHGQAAVLKGRLSAVPPPYDNYGSLANLDVTSNPSYYDTNGSARFELPAGTRDFAISYAFGAQFVNLVPPATPTSREFAFFYGGVAKKAILTYLPYGQKAFYVSCAPPAIRSGTGTSCHVSIGSDVAPAGGLTVTLASSSPEVTVPATVQIGAGYGTGQFYASGGAVPALTPVTITATEGARVASVVVEVVAPVVSNLWALPSRVLAGGQSMGNVSLDAVGPPAGFSVALASSSPDITVPSAVAIPGGAAIATFPISVSSNASIGLVSLTATLNGRSRTTTIDIGPPRIAGVALEPTSLQAGASSYGLVTLDIPAPVGAVTVSLASSDSTVVQVPATVEVPAGATQANFTVTTSPVTATRSVTITASISGSSKTAAIEVRVAPPTIHGAGPGVALPGTPGIVVYGTGLGAATSVLLSGPVYPIGSTTPVCNIRGSQGPFCPEVVVAATPTADGKSLTFSLPSNAATGTYLLEAKAGQLLSASGVAFLVEEPSPSFEVVTPDDHKLAQRIYPGQTIQGVLSGTAPNCPYGATDYNQYFFFGTAGSRINVRMERVDESVPWSDPSSLDPQIEVVAPDGFIYGNLARFNDRPGVDFNATITNATLPQTGLYVIIAETARGGGEYRLSFSFSSLAPAPPESRVIPVAGNNVTGHVGDVISSWAAILDPRGHPLTGANTTFQQAVEPGDTGTIQFMSGANVQSSSIGTAAVTAKLTSFGRLRFEPVLQQTFTAPAASVSEPLALVAGEGSDERIPLYPAVAMRPFSVGRFDGQLLTVESSRFERFPLRSPAVPSGPVEEPLSGTRPRALDANVSSAAAPQPYGPEDEARGEVPVARLGVPKLSATSCQDGLRFHAFAVLPSAQISAPLTVTLEDLTPSTGASTPNGPVGERGIFGHRIEKEIRLRIKVRDANGNEPDYPVLVSVSVGGVAAGEVILDPDGSRIECPTATFIWHERDANGAIVALNEVIGYRLGTYSAFVGIDLALMPVWNWTELFEVKTFTPGQEMPSVQVFGVHPEPGKPDRIFCRDYFGQLCGDSFSYWTGYKAFENGKRQDDTPRLVTNFYTTTSAYHLVDKYENTLYGYFDSSIAEGVPSADVEFVPHVAGEVNPQAYKVRARWTNDPSWPSGANPATLSVHYPQDPDWPAGDLSRSITLNFEAGTSHALSKHRSYDLIRPDGTRGVDDGTFPLRAYSKAASGQLQKTEAGDGARLVLLAYRGEVVPGELPELEPTETGARVWAPEGDHWRILQTRTTSFLETAGPSSFRLTLIDHDWNVIQDGEFVVHRCPRFDHSAPGAGRPCTLSPVASVTGRVDAISLNPGGPGANDSRGYLGIELTRAPEGLGVYFVKVESLSNEYRIRRQSDFVTSSAEVDGEFQGAFKLVDVGDYPCPDARCGAGGCNQCTGSPNYVSSGTYTAGATDLVVPTSGPAIAVSRNYVSTPSFDGVVGPGWTSSLEARVYLAPYISGGVRLGTEANVVLPSGLRYKFRLNPVSGRFDPPAGRTDDLLRNADGSFDLFLERGSGSVYRFDKHGRLVSETDEFGNVVSWERDAEGRVTRMADFSGTGRSVTIGWTGAGKVHTLSDSAGRVVTYDYDADSRLTGITDPAGRRTQYDYSRGRYSTALLTRISDPWGRAVTDITYDNYDRTKSYTEQGATYTYTYAASNRTTKVDDSGHSTENTFDPDSGVITSRSDPGDAFNKVFDSEGRPVQVTDAAGVLTTYTYDGEGHVLTVTRNASQTGAVRYDYAYDPAFPDKVASVTPKNPTTNVLDTAWQGWRYEYHPAGSTRPGGLKRVYRVASDGTTADSVSEYEYDGQGRVRRQTTAGGAQTDYDYDGSGNLQTVTGPAGSGARPVTTYQHDALGRVTDVTDPLGKVTHYTYDPLGRVLTVSLPPTGGRTFTTTYSYDHVDVPAGLLYTEITDPNGRLTRLGYDVDGRLRRSVDAAGGATLYGYTGRLLTTITDPNGNVTNYGYDAAKRLASTSFPDGGQETYTYWNDGLLKTKTDRRGTTVTYAYDAFKRLKTKSYSTGGSVTYNYEGQKLLTVVDTTVSPAETHTFDYDTRYRLASAAQAGRGTAVYTYTVDDRVESLTLPGGVATTWGYHADGSLQSALWSPISGSFTWDYTARGQYETVTFPNGQERAYGYDDQGRLTTLSNTLGATTLASTTYGYDLDLVGQPTLLGQRTSQTATFPAQGLTGALTRYGYDPLYQLVRAEYPAAAPFNSEVHTWTYDGIGNRETQAVGANVQTYMYLKAAGNPLNGQRLTGDGADAFGYDAAGNVTGRQGPGGAFTFGYDPENRLKSVTGPENATYTYDYQGRRTSKTVSGVKTTYLYDGLNLVSETTGGQTTYFLNGPGIDEPLAMSRSGAVSYFSVDGLGSVVATNDPAGSVTHSVVFDAWGNVKAETGSRMHPFTYTGREVGEAGFHFYRARFYQPGVGRFIQEDPMGQAAGQASLYGYARSSPSQAIDPAGLLTVHVWTPHDDGWGHASITLENGTHISWWPSAHGREGSYYPEQPYLYSAPPNKYQSFYRDVELEGNRLPDYSIKIDGLDEDAIEKWWDTFRKANRWKTLSQNCSTVAATALRKGGARVPPQLVWTPEDVLRLTASIRRQAEIASPPTARQGLTIPPALNRTFQ